MRENLLSQLKNGKHSPKVGFDSPKLMFGPIFGRFSPFSTVSGQFWPKTAKIDSKSAALRAVAQCVLPCGGRRSVAGSQVTARALHEPSFSAAFCGS